MLMVRCWHLAQTNADNQARPPLGAAAPLVPFLRRLEYIQPEGVDPAEIQEYSERCKFQSFHFCSRLIPCFNRSGLGRPRERERHPGLPQVPDVPRGRGHRHRPPADHGGGHGSPGQAGKAIPAQGVKRQGKKVDRRYLSIQRIILYPLVMVFSGDKQERDRDNLVGSRRLEEWRLRTEELQVQSRSGGQELLLLVGVPGGGHGRGEDAAHALGHRSTRLFKNTVAFVS